MLLFDLAYTTEQFHSFRVSCLSKQRRKVEMTEERDRTEAEVFSEVTALAIV